MVQRGQHEADVSAAVRGTHGESPVHGDAIERGLDFAKPSAESHGAKQVEEANPDQVDGQLSSSGGTLVILLLEHDSASDTELIVP